MSCFGESVATRADTLQSTQKKSLMPKIGLLSIESAIFHALSMTPPPPTLFILGVGNTLRSDDGIGTFICEQLAALPLHHTDISFSTDISTDWLELFASFERVVIVDACAGGETVRFGPAGSHPHPPARVSHYLDTESLPELLAALYDGVSMIYLCSVPGEDFSMGEGLSPRGQVRAEEALTLLKAWLAEEGYLSAG
jgi:hydrogenase maturation protease